MMLDPAIVSSINHVLRGNGWALERLKTHAGRTARFDCLPFSLALTVLENGEVGLAAAEPAPDVAVRLTPGVMLRVLARDDTVWNEIGIGGDTAFAATLHAVFRNLRWDVEEDLARLFGDIAAHRMAETGRTLGLWHAQGLDNLARAFAEYWTEEEPLIASARDVGQFNRDVDRLRDDVARFEKRIEHLIHRQENG